ncbi:MAG: hypothetical protein KDB03_19760 [Planctomycetales bacterium]|nr:hypothetical protein [Planctomycetales bacterium]
MSAKKYSSHDKLTQFQLALGRLIERLSEDRYVLALVLEGSLSEETIWRRESISVWIIEADGVTRRLRSDGNDEHIYRILVEEGVNIHAEVIPRSRFKQMVEGASRTAFSCNFFAARSIVYARDPSIEKWFREANSIAVKDRERELLMFSTWTIYAWRSARKHLEIRQDFPLAQQELLNVAHSLAHTEIIRSGRICENVVIYRAMEENPGLFQSVYLDVLAKGKQRKILRTALDIAEKYLVDHYEEHLRPLLKFLQKADRVVPLSEIADHFAYTQVYPWHLESACEWLEQQGKLQKLSVPFKLTKRSQEQVEEPAYLLDS